MSIDSTVNITGFHEAMGKAASYLADKCSLRRYVIIDQSDFNHPKFDTCTRIGKIFRWLINLISKKSRPAPYLFDHDVRNRVMKALDDRTTLNDKTVLEYIKVIKKAIHTDRLPENSQFDLPVSDEPKKLAQTGHIRKRVQFHEEVRGRSIHGLPEELRPHDKFAENYTDVVEEFSCRLEDPRPFDHPASEGPRAGNNEKFNAMCEFPKRKIAHENLTADQRFKLERFLIGIQIKPNAGSVCQ